ncbi:sulfotransferase [uncultured Marinobacter sp.]|uniref:sulfotransferase family protein n=1 Tax=uncultured Marinobacter sp. TaxID=187379 RepID=UPI0030DB4F06
MNGFFQVEKRFYGKPGVNQTFLKFFLPHFRVHTTIIVEIQGEVFITAASKMKAETRPPFFIIGCGRSGTTLLATVLNAHPDIDIPRADALYDIYGPFVPIPAPEAELSDRQWRRLLNMLTSDVAVRNWEHPPQPSDLRLDHSRKSFSTAYRALHEFHARTSGCCTWGAKMVGGEQRINRLLSDFPEAKFIYCLRDPRAVVQSLLETDFGPTNLWDATQQWAGSVRMWREAQRRYPDRHFLTLRYEDLVLNTGKSVAEVLHFLSVPWHPSVEAYHESEFAKARALSPEHANLSRRPDAALIDRWIEQMAPEKIARIEQILGDELLSQGYILKGPPPSDVARPKPRRYTLRERARSVTQYLLTSDPVRRNSFLQRHYRKWLYSVWKI